MTFKYNVSGRTLTVELDLTKNIGSVFLNGQLIGEMNSHKELANGKVIQVDKSNTLFVKFINPSEGFTVMLNNVHISESAGHPKKLMKRTLAPLLIGVFCLLFQLFYVYYDLNAKGDLEAGDADIKVITYVSYHTLIVFILLGGFQLARRGNWRGVLIGFITLLFNLLFCMGTGLYYNTGFNLFFWFFLFSQAIVLVLLYSHLQVIKYVRSYTKELKPLK